MNIDPELLSRLSGMDHKELSDKVAAASKLLGIDAESISKIIGEPEDIQKKLQGMSDAELKKILEKIDPSLLKKLTLGDK